VEPRAVFCSTKACSESFGFTSQNAYTVATVGVVISNRGWKPYFVRHELIHHLQNERLGSLRTWLLKPVWFREGMAYSLSRDPRRPLPGPLQGYRSEFETWFKRVGSARLYARPLELHAGLRIAQIDVVRELQEAGYGQGPREGEPGWFANDNDWLEVAIRPFVFWDGPQPAKRVRIAFEGGAVRAVQDA